MIFFWSCPSVGFLATEDGNSPDADLYCLFELCLGWGEWSLWKRVSPSPFGFDFELWDFGLGLDNLGRWVNLSPFNLDNILNRFFEFAWHQVDKSYCPSIINLQLIRNFEVLVNIPFPPSKILLSWNIQDYLQKWTKVLPLLMKQYCPSVWEV